MRFRILLCFCLAGLTACYPIYEEGTGNVEWVGLLCANHCESPRQLAKESCDINFLFLWFETRKESVDEATGKTIYSSPGSRHDAALMALYGRCLARANRFHNHESGTP